MPADAVLRLRGSSRHMTRYDTALDLHRSSRHATKQTPVGTPPGTVKTPKKGKK